PEATLWAIKVLDAEGHGPSGQTLVALDALYGERHEHGGLHVVNLSLVTSAYGTHDHCDKQPFPPGDHFRAEALVLARFREAGIAVFAASANNGLAAVSFPACLSSTLAVGAVYDAD
ncbi:MAG TPA: S8 family serine peptidase, partial [Thermoanaerobaculia bacterium]|nr:S8 family serine peptidase [Thermoanaerobaculia bacterium]